MRKVDLGQTISIVANVGVLIGILLLVYELYQNRLMMRAQARSDISDSLVEILIQQALDPDFTDIGIKARAGLPLTEVEAEQFRTLQQAFWRYRENVSYQWRQGLFDDEEYEAQREVWVRNLNTYASMRAIWCERGGIQSGEFVAEINALMDEPCE